MTDYSEETKEALAELQRRAEFAALTSHSSAFYVTTDEARILVAALHKALRDLEMADEISSEYIEKWQAACAEVAELRRQASDVNLIRRAIADPGQFLPRGDNFTESIPSWSARAVACALGLGDERTGDKT